MSTAQGTGTREREQFEDMGPIDYVVLEWPGRQPEGEAAPLLLDLADRGVIRILDIAILLKEEDGTIATLEVGDLGPDNAFTAFDGAASGLLGADELSDAAGTLAPGTSAAVLIWENRWAAPVAKALRRSGGQLVASGRIPVQAIAAALDQIDARSEA